MPIQTIKATLQMRRGLEQDFDPDQMVVGEWAVSTDKKYVRMCIMPGLCIRMATYEAFEEDMIEIQEILATCQDIQVAVDAMGKLVEKHSKEALDYSTMSKSYAVGGTGSREGEDSDNAKYYSEQAKAIAGGARVTGVKGAKEESYRDGNVNLTSGNIGAIPLEGVGRTEGSTVGERSFAYGRDVEASGVRSAAFGRNNKATGNNSFVCGSFSSATGSTAYAEGYNNVASGENSHAEGDTNKSSGYCAHAEGKGVESAANQSHAEGYGTKAIGMQSHAEGYATSSASNNSHVEGYGCVTIGKASHAEGIKTVAGNGYILFVSGFSSVEKKLTFDQNYENFSTAFSKITVGAKIHVMNNYSELSIPFVFAVSEINESEYSVVSEESIPDNFTPELAVLLVEGSTGAPSHAEGSETVASGSYSHAEGRNTTASGLASHAEGYNTIANGWAQTVCGKFNNKLGKDDHFSNPFVVGNGTKEESRANAFRITASGAVYGKGAYNSSGADYAEFIRPWADGNENNEDRVGYFVTVKDGYLYKANEGDYIAGITSGNPSIVGNSDEEYYWRWERDEFNRVLYKEVPEAIEKVGEDGRLFTEKSENTVKVPKQSEEYDVSLQQSYVERKDRKEWDYVGMVGVVPVRDDGSCEVGRFCKCKGGGIATIAEKRGFDTYMVIDRISDNIVSVILK